MYFLNHLYFYKLLHLNEYDKSVFVYFKILYGNMQTHLDQLDQGSFFLHTLKMLFIFVLIFFLEVINLE